MKNNLISRNLKFLREKSNMTQEQVADKLGLGRDAIIRIENGNRKVEVEELEKFAHLYDISRELIIYGNLEDKSDIAVSGVISEYNNYISAESRYEINYHQVIDSSFALRIMAKYYMQNFYISPNMNNRVYKKSLVVDNSICNDFSKQAQDNYSSFFAFLYASKVSLVPDIYYHYYQRSGSAVHSFSEEYINNYFNVLKHIKQTLKDINQLEKNKEVFMCFTDRSINWIVSCLIKANIKEATQKKCLKLIRNNCLDLFSADDYIDYLDTKRILKLFD